MALRAAAVLLAAVAAAAAFPAAHAAAAEAPGLLASLGTGVPAPANCTPAAALADQWLEVTQLLNYTQWKSTAGQDLSGMPDPAPFPWSLSAEDTKAPGFYATCISRSTSAPEDCTGDECFVYTEEWGIEWVEFAKLDCFGAYPALGSTNFFDPEPAPGNISLVITEQCKNYHYSSGSGYPFFYSITDEWGNKWALQTAQTNLTTEAEWDAYLAQAVFPPGWGAVEKLPLNSTAEIHTPYMVDGRCIIPVFKDSLFNTWHAYTYPEGGLTSGNSLLGAMGASCEPLDAQYTAKYTKQSAEEAESGDGAGAAPAPAPSTPASAAALDRAPVVVLGALAAAAAAALLF